MSKTTHHIKHLLHTSRGMPISLAYHILFLLKHKHVPMINFKYTLEWCVITCHHTTCYVCFEANSAQAEALGAPLVL